MMRMMSWWNWVVKKRWPRWLKPALQGLDQSLVAMDLGPDTPGGITTMLATRSTGPVVHLAVVSRPPMRILPKKLTKACWMRSDQWRSVALASARVAAAASRSQPSRSSTTSRTCLPGVSADGISKLVTRGLTTSLASRSEMKWVTNTDTWGGLFRESAPHLFIAILLACEQYLKTLQIF